MDSAKRKPLTAKVWGEFLRTALIWLIPALLALPIVLVVIAVSMVAGDGGLFEAGEGSMKGGLATALGPVLILVGVAAIVFTAMHASEAADYGEGGFFGLTCIGIGIYMSVRELRALAQRS